MTVTQPSQDPNKDTATSAWEQQVTEATNRMQHQIDNINESVNVPSNLIAIYAKTQDGQGQQFTPYSDGAGFIAHVVYTDTLPTLPVTGATFSAYSDTVVDTTIRQYIEQSARPTNPGTTSYQVSGGVWSSSSGWTKTKLTRAGINVWFSEAKIIGTAGQTVVAKWTDPKLLFGGAIANGILYYNVAQTSAPSAPPVGSSGAVIDGYDYDSGVFSLANNAALSTIGWQYLPITAAMGGGTTISHKHWQVTFQVETDEVTNSQIITFGTVEGVIPIGADLQSDTYSAGSAGWKIERGTGNAEFNNITARGSITAESIDSGTLSVDRIGTNALGMTKLTTDIQSSNFSSGSAGWRIQQSGSSEFNGVVVSRQLVAASGTYNIPSTALVPLGIYHVSKTYFINIAGLGTTPWVNTSKTYVPVVGGITGASVSAPTSAVPNVDWGWQADVILNTTWGGGTGTPAFTGVVMRVQLWTRYVNNIQGTLQWKVYEVT